MGSATSDMSSNELAPISSFGFADSLNFGGMYLNTNTSTLSYGDNEIFRMDSDSNWIILDDELLKDSSSYTVTHLDGAFFAIYRNQETQHCQMILESSTHHYKFVCEPSKAGAESAVEHNDLANYNIFMMHNNPKLHPNHYIYFKPQNTEQRDCALYAWNNALQADVFDICDPTHKGMVLDTMHNLGVEIQRLTASRKQWLWDNEDDTTLPEDCIALVWHHSGSATQDAHAFTFKQIGGHWYGFDSDDVEPNGPHDTLRESVESVVESHNDLVASQDGWNSLPLDSQNDFVSSANNPTFLLRSVQINEYDSRSQGSFEDPIMDDGESTDLFGNVDLMFATMISSGVLIALYICCCGLSALFGYIGYKLGYQWGTDIRERKEIQAVAKPSQMRLNEDLIV